MDYSMDYSEPIALSSVFDDNVEHEKILFNISDKQAKIFGGTIVAVAVLDLLATLFLLWVTFVTTAMDGMKSCEKLLVFNVLIPDLVFEFITLYFITPATFGRNWHYGIKDTQWLAFILTFCIFHTQMASATICHVLALSKTDAYKFEMANDMKHMSVVVMSTLSVSICFCSLPATEDEGYGFQHNWLCPSFNTHHQYGSVFMSAGILGIVAYVELQSIYKLFDAKKFYQEKLTRATKKAFEELEKEIVYCIVSMATACMVIPTIIGIPDVLLMFIPRVILYIFPLVRVAIFINYCPHFQFAYFGQEDVQDFAALHELEHDILPNNPVTAPGPAQPEPEQVLEPQPSLFRFGSAI